MFNKEKAWNIILLPFSSCLRSFPASGSFPMSQLFSSGRQSIEVSASVLLMNIQGWFPLGFTCLISLQSKGLPIVFSSITIQKHQLLGAQPSLWSNSCLYMTSGKTIAFSCGSIGKESTCNAGDLGLIPELGRSPGEGKGYPLLYSGLENSMDCIFHGVAKSQTQLSDVHCYFSFSIPLCK